MVIRMFRTGALVGALALFPQASPALAKPPDLPVDLTGQCDHEPNRSTLQPDSLVPFERIGVDFEGPFANFPTAPQPQRPAAGLNIQADFCVCGQLVYRFVLGPGEDYPGVCFEVDPINPGVGKLIGCVVGTGLFVGDGGSLGTDVGVLVGAAVATPYIEEIPVMPREVVESADADEPEIIPAGPTTFGRFTPGQVRQIIHRHLDGKDETDSPRREPGVLRKHSEARFLYYVGQRCRDGQNYDMARNCFEEVQRLSPNSSFARKAAEQIREIAALQTNDDSETSETPEASETPDSDLQYTEPLELPLDDVVEVPSGRCTRPQGQAQVRVLTMPNALDEMDRLLSVRKQLHEAERFQAEGDSKRAREAFEAAYRAFPDSAAGQAAMGQALQLELRQTMNEEISSGSVQLGPNRKPALGARNATPNRVFYVAPPQQNLYVVPADRE